MKRALLVFLIVQTVAFAEQRNETYHLRGKYNYAVRKHYPELYRQLSAAPFVHTLPVQLLIDQPEEGRKQAAEFDLQLYGQILRHALNPPSIPPSEEILAPDWPKTSWKTAYAMEWAHMLHDQMIDILADDRIQDKQSALQRAIQFYLADPLAITDKPLKVDLLSRFPYSHEFHHAYPRVMGIMMSYHWLQGAQHDAMLQSVGTREDAVRKTLARFREMLLDPPTFFPLTHKAAPEFHKIVPQAGYIFDNLHILHHIAQDILITTKITNKHSELYRILPLFLYRSASPENFAAGPQDEPPMPGALHQKQGHEHAHH